MPKSKTVPQEMIENASRTLRDNHASVLLPSELQSLLGKSLSGSVRFKDLQTELQRHGIIENTILRSDGYRDVKRVAVRSLKPSPYDFALSIRRGAYLSHASAVHLLGLTEQQPRTIYVNKEQSEKPRPAGALSQPAIDRAFSRPQRRSKYVFRIGETQIVLLSGKATNSAGVVVDPSTGHPTTNLERTLIDITVRPRYAGGVFQVMTAFVASVNEIDFDRLMGLLRTLNYKYPYHQAIGFYLSRTEADPAVLDQIRSLGVDFDFYLDYAMASAQYDKSWRIYYPLGV